MDQTKRKTEHWFESATVSVEQYFFFSSLALIVLFAWMEPAGAAGVGFAKGLVFWTIQIAIIIPLLIQIQQLTSHYFTLKTPRSPWIQTAMSGVCAALLFVPIAYSLDALFAMPEDDASIGLLRGLLDEAAGVVVPVTVTWIALNAPWILQLDFSRRPIQLPSPQLNAPIERPANCEEHPTRFLHEVNSRATGDLVSISSELHYVRVVTTDAEVMFLYNLRDAVGELPADAGVQIHRSHWVSRRHIRDITKRDGNFECVLSNGKILPVSRRKYAEVKKLL
ncbi:MAG: LytTR family DNA-binding domain-containing protein [Pseudomonadota bacterium]